jgi:V8-like Glu-specific endopeptidase
LEERGLRKRVRVRLRSTEGAMIIGQIDDREIEYNLDLAPHNAVALVKTYYRDYPDLTGYGTGFLIGGRRLATAGHVLWGNLNGASARNILPDKIKLHVGEGLFAGHSELIFNIPDAPKAIRIHPDFLNGQNTRDVATIELAASPAPPAATLPQLPFPARLVTGQTVWVSGYPLKRAPFGCYEGSGALADLDGPVFEHQADTTEGQSGAPIRIKRDGVWQAIGIHIGDSAPGPDGVARNRALALTSEIIGWLHD